MANSWDGYRVNWTHMELMRLVVNNLDGGIASQFNRGYNADFEQGFPIGRTTRVPLRFRPKLRRGKAIEPNDVVIPETDITVGEPFGVDYGWDDMEKMFDMRRTEAQITEDFLQPAAAAMAQDIENRCAEFAALNTPNAVGALQTSPADANIARQARTLLRNTAGWQPDLTMNVSSYAMETMVAGERSTFNPQNQISEAYENGALKRAAGFTWNESESLMDFTVGSAPNAITVNGSNQTGSTLNVSGTNGDVIKAGTIIVIQNAERVNPSSKKKIDNNRAGFVVQQDATIAGGVAALSIYPAIMPPGDGMSNVTALPVNGATVTIMPNTASPSGKAGKIGLCFAKDAFALVTGKFPQPFTGESKTLSLKGMPVKIRQWFFSDGRTGDHFLRFDCVIGMGRLQPDVAAVRLHIGS